MVREDRDCGSRHAALLVDLAAVDVEPAIRVLARTERRQPTQDIVAARWGDRVGLRLVRHGERLLAYARRDGEPWGPPLAILDLPGLADDVLVGVAASGAEPPPREAFEALQVTFSGLQLLTSVPAPVFIRGDVSEDGSINVADPIAILMALFAGAPALPCYDAADANDDGAVDLADAVGILAYLFQRGPPPAEPFPACGEDGSEPDGLPHCVYQRCP
jgi:hypothetical protein